MGTARNGLSRLDGDTGSFKTYKHDFNDPKSLSNNAVSSIYEDSKGVLWVGTYGGALNRMLTPDGEFDHFGTADGMPDAVVYAILEDDVGNLWMSTNAGITRFNGARGVAPEFTNFKSRHGLQGDEYNSGAYFQSGRGEMFFGGMNGLNAFYPERIRLNQHAPPVFLSTFNLNQVPVNQETGPGGELDRPINSGNRIRLEYKNYNVLTFKFTALHYANPQLNQYAYRLTGFLDSWTYSGNRRIATFTGLAPGEYNFHVKGSNSDGVWNEDGLIIPIEISGPWWMTTAAQIGLSISVLFLGFVLFRYRVRRVQNLNRELEEKIVKRTRDAVVANRAKSDFLARMSHEIRSPMNSILGFSELLDGLITDKQQRRYLKSIRTSGDTLLFLINDILDLSKIEAGKVIFETKDVNVSEFMEEIEALFCDRIEEKGLGCSLKIDPDLPSVLKFDPLRMRQILVNLLDNAIKFTNEGHIGVSWACQGRVSSPDDTLVGIELQVSDTGIGVPNEELETIFEKFEQRTGQQTSQFGGTGLGLSICRLLVEKMNGQIQVNSKVGQGTTFTIQIPDVPIGSGDSSGPDQRIEAEFDSVMFKGATVLVVDDISLNRELLIDYLEPHNLNVIEAENGKIAVGMALGRIPDIILMDISMPVMDGMEAAKIIKEHPDTSHIPVFAISATASTQMQSQIDSQFDVFLQKPVGRIELIKELVRYLDGGKSEGPSTTGPLSGSGETMVSHQEVPGGMDRAALLAKLRDMESEWLEIRHTMTINDIEAFAVQIKNLGVDASWHPLVAWAEELEDKCAEFDLVSISSSLEKYTDFVAQLQSGAENGSA